MRSTHWQLTFALTLLLSNFLINLVPVQGQPIILLDKGFLKKPPRTPPPDGPSGIGGGLDNSTNSCQNPQKKVISLIPLKSEQRLTASEYPTFWFYVPDAPENVEYGRFSLLTLDETQYVYRINFKLPKTPGIVSISLPPSLKNKLEVESYYRWYFLLYCQGNTSTKPNIERHGWIRRETLTPERSHQIETAMPDMWYDSLTRLGKALQNSPQDRALKADWDNLLKSANLELSTQESFAGEVLLIEK